MALSVANLGGRFTMASLSDSIGCKNTFNMIIGGSLPIFLAAPVLVSQVSGSVGQSVGPSGCGAVGGPVGKCACVRERSERSERTSA